MRSPLPVKGLLLWLGGVLIFTARAHEGAELEIEELTEILKVHQDSADLLIQRAIEYKVLGKLNEAVQDLDRALTIERESVAARRELSQAYLALGKTNQAMETVTRALASPAGDAEHAALLMIRAGILRGRRDYTNALSDASEAIRRYPQNVEWYLARSDIQACLKFYQPRVSGLEDGIRQTGSGMLFAEWVDALIDAGQFPLALEKITEQLEQLRWKAAWLIRRARIEFATSRIEEARSDVRAALEEMNPRLNTGLPDALLLADRGKAYDLLGKQDEALSDYSAARERGLADEWLVERVRALRALKSGEP